MRHFPQAGMEMFNVVDSAKLALLHSAEPKWHFWSSLVQTFWTSVWMYSFELAGEKVPTKVEWMLSYSTQTDGDFVVKFKLVFACHAEKYLKI